MDAEDPGNLMRVHSKDLHEHIAQEVGDCLESGLYTDLMVRCKDGHTLHAHKLVLSAVSPYLKWLLENNDWEELQTLELPDASLEELQLLLDVVYNGSVEATIEDLRKLIVLSHRLYISIPLSDELMHGLDLSLPDQPPFMPPPKISSLLNSLKARTESVVKAPNGSSSSKPSLNPLIKQMSPLPLAPLTQDSTSSAAAAATAATANGTPSPAFRRKLDPSVMTAIMANSKNAEHVCPLCNFKFSKAALFKQHMKSHEDNDELREQRNAVLGEMIATCFNPQTSLYTCHVCNSNYNHSGNFKQHLLKHERESGSISATLVAQVGGNPHLTNVLQSAMADRVDKCDSESEEKRNQYRCEHCGRTFKHPGNYKQHLSSHGKGSSALSIGGVSSNGTAKRPTTMTVGISPKLPKLEVTEGSGLFPSLPLFPFSPASSSSSSVSCPACASEFSSVESLQVHISTNHKHLDTELPPELQQTFRDRANVVLCQKQQYKCEICSQGFRSEAFLNQHKMSFHKMSISLEATSGPPSLIHKTGNSFECQFCGKCFNKMSKLTQHVKIHSHPDDHYKYPCDVCGKKFTRPHHVTRHKLLHTGENPFKCSRCNVGFPRMESLRTHEARGCSTEQTYRNRMQRLPDQPETAEQNWHVPVDSAEEMIVDGYPENEDDNPAADSDDSLEEPGGLSASISESLNGSSNKTEATEETLSQGNLIISGP